MSWIGKEDGAMIIMMMMMMMLSGVLDQEGWRRDPLRGRHVGAGRPQAGDREDLLPVPVDPRH